MPAADDLYIVDHKDQIAMAMGRFDSNNPRYKCCGLKIDCLAPVVCYIEIGIMILLLLVVLPVTSTEAPGALPVVSISLTIYCVVKLGITGCALWGVKRRQYQFLIAYLVFKGIEIGGAVVGMLVVFLIMMGFTMLFGVSSSFMSKKPPVAWTAPGFPEDDPAFEMSGEYYDQATVEAVTASGDYHAHVNAGGGGGSGSSDGLNATDLTGIFVSMFVGLGTILGLGVFFFIVILKCYRLGRDRTYVAYQHKMLSKASSLPCSLRRRTVGDESSPGPDEFDHRISRLAVSVGDLRRMRESTDANTEMEDEEGLIMMNGSPGRYTKLATTQTSFPPPPYSKEDPSPAVLTGAAAKGYHILSQDLSPSHSHVPVPIKEERSTSTGDDEPEGSGNPQSLDDSHGISFSVSPRS